MLGYQERQPVLNTKHNLRGMTLVEIMVAIVIIGILFAAAAPDFSVWIQNTKIRSATDTLQNGLTLAKTEAVHRNTITQFVSCGGSNWDVIAASSTANTSVCNTAATAGWERVQQSPQNGANTVFVNAGQATIGFNGLGRQVSTTDPLSGAATPNPPVAVDININATLAGATSYAGSTAECAVNAGKLRCLRISVSPGGQVRMCDPALAAGGPQGC